MDNKQLLKIALVVLVLCVLYKWWHNSRYTHTRRMERYVPVDTIMYDTLPPPDKRDTAMMTAGGAVAGGQPLVPPTNVAADLLPKPETPQVMDFGEFAPKALQGQNFLEVSKQLGVDTQGSSMRNANYQLRADPPNPRTNVGPWQNSTIEADLLRRPLE